MLYIIIRWTYILNINVLASTKGKLQDLTVCIAVKILKAYCDLDLDPTIPNIELV